MKPVLRGWLPIAGWMNNWNTVQTSEGVVTGTKPEATRNVTGGPPPTTQVSRGPDPTPQSRVPAPLTRTSSMKEFLFPVTSLSCLRLGLVLR